MQQNRSKRSSVDQTKQKVDLGRQDRHRHHASDVGALESAQYDINELRPQSLPPHENAREGLDEPNRRKKAINEQLQAHVLPAAASSVDLNNIGQLASAPVGSGEDGADPQLLKGMIGSMRMKKRVELYGKDFDAHRESRNGSNPLVSGDGGGSSILQFEQGEEKMLNQEINMDAYYDNDSDGMDTTIQTRAHEDQAINLHWSLIRHNNSQKVKWDIFIILLVLFNCYTIPMEVAFQNISWMRSKPYEIAEYLIDLSFAFDILIAFRTTFIKASGNEEFNPRNIAREYVIKSSSFTVDLLATIPFELVFLAVLPAGALDGDLQQYQQFLGMLKLVRLLRLRRIVKLLKSNPDAKTRFKIVSFISVLLMIIHWIGCMWYLFVAAPELSEPFVIPEGKTWIDVAHEKTNNQFSGIWLPPYNLNDQATQFYYIEDDAKYIAMFYYGIILLVGNEIAPVDPAQYIFSAAMTITGSVFMAWLFGSIAATVQSMNMKNTAYEDKLDLVQSNMKAISLDEKMQKEFLDFLDILHETPSANKQDFAKFLELLSPSLKLETLRFINQKIIKNELSPFNNCLESETQLIVSQLRLQLYSPEERIVNQGEYGTDVYFIVSGLAEVILERVIPLHKLREVEGYRSYSYQKTMQRGDGSEISLNKSVSQLSQGILEKDHGANTDKQLIATLGEGQYFGEIAAMTGHKHTASVRSAYNEDIPSTEQCLIVAAMPNHIFKRLEEEAPAIFLTFKKQVKKYEDRDMLMRKAYVKNVPYFRNLNDDTIQQISFLMNTKQYDAGSLIVQRGDVLTDIYIIKEGIVEVEVPYNNKFYFFDFLPPGSCFSVFSPFGLDVQQVLNFRAKTSCVIETINVKKDKRKKRGQKAKEEDGEKVEEDVDEDVDEDEGGNALDGDLIELSKRDHTLSPIIKQFKLQQENDMLTPFDFFRYNSGQSKLNAKSLRRQKRLVVKAVLKFCNAYKEGKQSLPVALTAIRFLEEHRAMQRSKLKLLTKEDVQKNIVGVKNNQNFESTQMSVGDIKHTQLIPQQKDAHKIAEMFKILTQRQQFSAIEGGDDDEEVGVGENLPNIENVADAYRSAMSASNNSPTPHQTNENLNIDKGGETIDTQAYDSNNAFLASGMYRSQNVPSNGKDPNNFRDLSLSQKISEVNIGMENKLYYNTGQGSEELFQEHNDIMSPLLNQQEQQDGGVKFNNYDAHIEQSNQQNMLTATLEMQHAQIEEVNEIIQEQNEMINHLRDLYRVEVAKQIFQVAQMQQTQSNTARNRRNSEIQSLLTDIYPKDKQMRNRNRPPFDESTQNRSRPDSGTKGRKRPKFNVESPDHVQVNESDSASVGGLLNHEDNLSILNERQQIKLILQSKEPEPEDGDIMSEANRTGNKKK